MDEFKITATQDTDLTELERIRINMAYNFYCEELKQYDNQKLLGIASRAVHKADTLLKALGYEME